MVQSQKAAIEFLVAYQQFSQAIEPTISDFDNPTSRPFVWLLLKLDGLLAATFNVRVYPSQVPQFASRF